MKRKLCLFALILSLAAGSLFFPRNAGAITYGFVDSTNTFANTGAFIARAPNGEIFPLCSGVMVTSNVFLTASHCTVAFTDEFAPEGYTAFVSLDGLIPFGGLSDATTNLLPVAHVVTNPNHNQSQSDSGDVGVLILQNPVAVT